MADTKIQIDIEANVAAATKAIQGFIDQLGIEIKEGISIYQAFDNKIQETADALKKASDPKQVAQLTAELKRLQSGFQSIKVGEFATATNTAAKGVTNLKNSAGAANTSIINFSRVIADAPFGILGVANNIDPLVQSFQGLKSSAGGTGNAIKAFVGGLIGPAGIALAVTAVTSALIKFGPEIEKFIFGTSGATEEQKKFNEELRGAQQGAAATGIKLQSLLSIYQDESNSYEIRRNALAQLQEATKGYNITINEQTIASGLAAKAIDALTNSLIAQATAEKLADKAAEVRIRQIDDIKNYQKAQADVTKAQEAFNNELVRFQQGATPYKNQSRALADVQNKLNIATENLTKASGQYRTTTQELNVVVTDSKNELERALAVTKKSGDADKAAAEAAKKLARQKKEIEKASKDAAKTQEELDKARLARQREIEAFDEQTFGKIISREQALENVRIEAEKKRRQEQNKRREDAARALEFGAQVPADIAKNVGIPAPVSQAAADAAKAQADAIKQVAQATNDAQAAFSLLSPTIDAAFNSLANGTSIADAVGQAIKQLIINLIKAVAQAALLSLIFSLLPGGSAGQSLLQSKGGFGSVLKNLLGFGARGNAIGGPVSGGQGYIVGENGPELFVPGTPGSIVPNMALTGSGGGNVSFEIRGDVLYGLLRRTANNKMANFG